MTRHPCAARAIALAASLFAFTAPVAQAETYRDTSVPMQTEQDLDLQRYLGKWYEIARFPNRFEKGCAGVTADYGLREDGRISVLNSCRKGGVSGPLETAEGVARPNGAGKLEVTFVPVLGLLPFLWGEYWVLDVNADYSVAVVGTPKGRQGWVLARSPKISAADFAAAQEVLRKNGYDTGALRMVPQTKDERD